MAAVIEKAVATVGVDTGLTHLSAALGIPTLCLFGSTNSKLTAAIGNNSMNLQSSFPCSPCQKSHCKFKQAEHSSYPPCYESLFIPGCVGLLAKKL